MPFNGSNTFTIVNTFVPGTTILSSAVNANFSDIATGLSDCVTRDAQGAVTGNLLFSSTGFLQLPNGTTGQRPGTAAAAYFRFNTTLGQPEYFDGTNWNQIAPTFAFPQGYLTLTSGTPVITSDVTAATAVYYTPYVGQLCPVYNGTNFVNEIFSEQTLTLVSNHLASTIYDVFAFLNSGVFTIGTGPAWNSSTAGSCSRGTGAGTTELLRVNGVLTNKNSITLRNGSTTYAGIAISQATYLGSIFIDSSAGQISCYRGYGQSRKWGVWNAFNRVPIILKAGDSTATWTYNSTWRASNGSSNNSLTVFSGLAEEMISTAFTQTIVATVGTTNDEPQIGIGWNSTTSPSGFVGDFFNGANNTGTSSRVSERAEYIQVPSLGINTVTALEQLTTGVSSATFNGAESKMVLSAIWRG